MKAPARRRHRPPDDVYGTGERALPCAGCHSGTCHGLDKNVEQQLTVLFPPMIARHGYRTLTPYPGFPQSSLTVADVDVAEMEQASRSGERPCRRQ